MIEAAHTEPLAAQSIAAQSILGQSWPTQPVQLELAQHGGGQSLLGLAATLFLIATPVLHLAFAWVVWSDYARLAADRRWRARLFGPRWLWALATALTGLFAATAYWLVHRSKLGPTPDDRGSEPPFTT